MLAVDPDSGEERFARVKVPEGLDRFVSAGSRLVPLESVIEHFLPALFPGMAISEQALFRVTRDADFEVSDDADDLLEAVESELRRRRFGDVIRVEVAASASESMLDRLRDGLGATDDEMYRIEGILDLADLMQLMKIDRPDLKDEPWALVDAAASRSREGRVALLRRDPSWRRPHPSALRVVPFELRGIRRRRSGGQGRDRDEDRGLPHVR